MKKETNKKLMKEGKERKEKHEWKVGKKWKINE